MANQHGQDGCDRKTFCLVTILNVTFAKMGIPVVHAGREIGSTPLLSSAVSDNVQRNARKSESRLHLIVTTVDCVTRRNLKICLQQKRGKKAKGHLRVVGLVKCWFVRHVGQSIHMA